MVTSRKSSAVTMSVVRIVVNGWTWWGKGEANNIAHAKRMLLEALNMDGWPSEPADVTITPGGFISDSFPKNYDREGGLRGWGSDSHFERLIPAASKAVERVIGTKKVMAALRSRTRLLTLGVDLNDTRHHNKGGTETHAEMVAVIDTTSGEAIGWTGKSYPVPAQERTLVHAPLESHLFRFGKNPVLILGCHDLNLFSQRGRASQKEGSRRRKRCDAIRKLAKKFKPVAVLQHPHTTDSPNIWSTAWSGTRQCLPTAKTCASGVAYCGGDENGPRASIEAVLERTAWGDQVVDVVVDGL